MRKREFVGVSTIFGVICAVVGFALYRRGNTNGFMRGYREADKQREFESIKSV